MSLEAILGKTLVKNDETKVQVSSLAEGSSDKVVGLYFSAHWCPPCRAFTPDLVKWYNNFKAKSSNGANLELVFVSADRDEDSFLDYFKTMPWLAVEYDNDDKAPSDVQKEFKVSGIPCLIFVDAKTGEVNTRDGRTVVTSDAEGAKFPWK
ncbi:nucleoredoxin-like [Asterias amurensis]|uniref:nucleoredoxin-like n=1 Tax=Asterias amurensis TaxID=7602 RepID=UPI003AB1DC38